MSRRLNIAEALRRNRQAETDPPALTGETVDKSHQLAQVNARSDQNGNDASLTFLDTFPALKQPFLNGYNTWSTNNALITRKGFARSLRLGLFDFLQRKQLQSLSFEQLDVPLPYRFVEDLNKRRTNGVPLTEAYRSRFLKAFETILENLRDSAEYGRTASTILKRFPRNQWPGFCHKMKPTSRLPIELLRTIIEAAESEIQEVHNRLKRVEHAAKLYGAMVDNPLPNKYSSELHDILIATFDYCFPNDELPNMVTFRNRFPRAVQAMGRHGFGYRRILEHFVPTARTLVPFILLIAVATAYNPSTILELNIQDIEYATRLGLPIIRISGVKRRAARDPVITLDASPTKKGFSLIWMFDLLLRYAKRLRPHIQIDSHKQRLFVCMQKQPIRYTPPRGFTGGNTPSSDGKFFKALKAFCNDHSIDVFALNQIRPTILDELHFQTGDLALAKQLGRHKRPETAWLHYTSDGTRKRYTQRLAEIFLLRERWHATNGCIDPRSRPVSMDVGAATPGFVCFDPLDSPRPGQRKHHLCTAYGECPSCPLAAAKPQDPVAVSYYLALHKAIFAAQNVLSSESWLTRWAPIAADLTALIELIPLQVKRIAMSFTTQLPPVT